VVLFGTSARRRCNLQKFSSTFLMQIFCTKEFSTAFLQLQFGFVIIWQKNIGAKPAYEMLVKLTTENNIIYILRLAFLPLD